MKNKYTENEILFYIYTFQDKLIRLLDIFFENGLMQVDHLIDYYYNSLKDDIKTLAKKLNIEIETGLPENLIKLSGNPDEKWFENTRSKAIDFLNIIENKLVALNLPKQKLSNEINKKLSEIDNALAEYKKYKDEFIKKDLENKKKSSQGIKPKIQAKGKITIIEILNENNRIKIYVNKDYENSFTPRFYVSDNKCWDSLIDIIDNGFTEHNQSIKKYFNSNNQNPLYKTLGYTRTKILSRNKDGQMINNIPIEFITREKIKRSLGQKK